MTLRLSPLHISTRSPSRPWDSSVRLRFGMFPTGGQGTGSCFKPLLGRFVDVGLTPAGTAMTSTPPNYRMKLTVRPVTSLAEGASAAPGRPAAYAERWADRQAKCV